MKNLTTKQAYKLIYEVGAHCAVYVTLLDDFGEKYEVPILGNATIYNFSGVSIGSSSNDWLASKAINLIKENNNIFRIYSSVFHDAIGIYEIID